jgi:hypothetical protein
MDLTKLFKEEQIQFPLTYLNDLVNSILNVDNEYCNWEARHIALQKSERVFAYELYHQFKSLTINKTEYLNTRFDGEIGKQIYQVADNCGTHINTNQLDYSPDLVLHKSQTDSNEENQKLIVEIKARNISDEDLAKDIIKLNHYVSSLNFQYAIFISVNTNERTIKQKIRRIFSIVTANRLSANFKRIIVINYKNRVITAERLYNLITG